jgi:hypothetical protein
MNYYDVMISGFHTASHVELRIDGHTLPFAKALVPRNPPLPLNGTLLLRRDKRTDNLLDAWHLSRAKKNCSLFMYNANGSLVGRCFLMGARAVKVETERRSGSLAGRSRGPAPSAGNDVNVETITLTYEKIEI